MDFPLDSRKALKDLEARLKQPTPPIPVISVKAQVEATKIVVQKELEPLISRLDTIEIKTLIPLKDGKDGKDGEKGPRGQDGREGPPGISGLDGKQGKDGKDGRDGKHGVSVVDAEIAVDDHLVFKLSDGEIIDVGELPSVDSTKIQHIISNSLQNKQVTVAATAPSAPSLYDLWYDIS